jgi:3-methyl-2-oxobutanoate hydroxymethyltransferase
MSVQLPVPMPPPPLRDRVTLEALIALKRLAQPLVMITAYDHLSARVAEHAGVDLVLVGDSAAMTMLGYPSTRGVSVEEMLMLVGAVRRGLVSPLLVGDLPFGSYEDSDEQAVATARRFTAAGCDAVKLEGAGAMLDRVRALRAAGVAVMGHVGLTPQAVTAPEGYRARGRSAEEAAGIVRDAIALEDAGCFALVVEAVPAPVAEAIVERVDIPVIGIGAGAAPDGQVLVLHDVLGLYDAHVPRFVKRYANLKPAMIAAARDFAAEVRASAFPGPEHTYGMEAGELAKFRALL